MRNAYLDGIDVAVGAETGYSVVPPDEDDVLGFAGEAVGDEGEVDALGQALFEGTTPPNGPFFWPFMGRGLDVERYVRGRMGREADYRPTGSPEYASAIDVGPDYAIGDESEERGDYAVGEELLREVADRPTEGEVVVGQQTYWPFWARGFDPYWETDIDDPDFLERHMPKDDEYFVPQPGGGLKKVVLGGSDYLHGCAVVVGASDPGLSVAQVSKAIREARPLGVLKARRFVQLAIAALNTANNFDKQEGATKRRSDLVRQLYNIAETTAKAGIDPLPDKAAEILREVVLLAVTEFNAVAEKEAGLQAAREQFLRDMYDEAKRIYEGAVAAAKQIAEDVAWYAKASTYVIGGAVLLLGFGLYKGLSSPTGQRVVGAYLGARR